MAGCLPLYSLQEPCLNICMKAPSSCIRAHLTITAVSHCQNEGCQTAGKTSQETAYRQTCTHGVAGGRQLERLKSCLGFCPFHPQGQELALRLYQDAVEAGRLDWRIPGVPLKAGAEGSSQQAASRAPPHVQARPPARAPSQAFRNASHASHESYSRPGGTPPYGETHGSSIRAMAPSGPSPSTFSVPSGAPRVSSRPNPSAAWVSSLHSSLLSHPSTSLRADNDEQTLSQSLSQAQPRLGTQTLSQSASQALHDRPAGGVQPTLDRQPFAEQQQQPAKSRQEEQVLRVMEITDCSYGRAVKVCIISETCRPVVAPPPVHHTCTACCP